MITVCARGPGGLSHHPSQPGSAWDRVAEALHRQILNLALPGGPKLSPRELSSTASRGSERYFTVRGFFSVFRLLKAHSLIAGPAYVVVESGRGLRDSHKVKSSGRSFTTFTLSRSQGFSLILLSSTTTCSTTLALHYQPGGSSRAVEAGSTGPPRLVSTLTGFAARSDEPIVHRHNSLSVDRLISPSPSDLPDWLDDENIEHVRESILFSIRKNPGQDRALTVGRAQVAVVL